MHIKELFTRKKNKLNEKKIKEEILLLFLDNHTQEEILSILEGKYPTLPKKKLKSLIQTNIFLSPKNMRLSTILFFFLFLLFPMFDIYLKGPYYKDFIIPIFILSIFISSIIILFMILLYQTNNLSKLLFISTLYMIYLAISIIFLTIIGIFIHIFTISLLHIIIYIILIQEYIALYKFTRYIKQIN